MLTLTPHLIRLAVLRRGVELRRLAAFVGVQPSLVRCLTLRELALVVGRMCEAKK